MALFTMPAATLRMALCVFRQREIDAPLRAHFRDLRKLCCVVLSFVVLCRAVLCCAMVFCAMMWYVVRCGEVRCVVCCGVLRGSIVFRCVVLCRSPLRSAVRFCAVRCWFFALRCAVLCWGVPSYALLLGVVSFPVLPLPLGSVLFVGCRAMRAAACLCVACAPSDALLCLCLLSAGDG